MNVLLSQDRSIPLRRSLVGAPTPAAVDQMTSGGPLDWAPPTQAELRNASGAAKHVSRDEFIKHMEGKHLILAFDDGAVDRMTFSTNRYGITTAAYSRIDGASGDTGPVNGAQNMPVKLSRDGKSLVMIADRDAKSGTYKYDLIVRVPLDREFVETGRSPVEADLRWGRTENANGFIEASTR